MTSPLEVLLVHQGKEHAADNEVCVMPMGLLSMADWLHRHGHPTEILHVRVEQAVTPEFALPRAVTAASPRLVCFDLHWHQQSRAVIDLVKEVREGAPDVVIVLGGYTASAFAAEILEQCPAVDYIIRGDGEIPLNALVEALQAETPLERVPNLCWRDQGRVRQNAIRHVNSAADLGRFTYSHFEHLRHHRYYTQAGVMEGEICVRDPLAPGIFYCNCGRGCPYNCTFCGGAREAQRELGGRTQYVFRPAEAMVRDLRRMATHNLDTWYNTFDPSPDHTYFLDLFDRIRAEGLGISMIHECLHLPSAEFLQRFAATFGPRSRLDFVLLTASDELRRRNKDNYFSRADLMRCIEQVEHLGIRGDLCFLTGLPFEEEHHVRESIAMAEEVGRRFGQIAVNAEVLAIEPLAPMNSDPESYGIRSKAQTFADYYRGHGSPRFFGFTPHAYSAERAHELAQEHEAAWRAAREIRSRPNAPAATTSHTVSAPPGPSAPAPRRVGDLGGDRSLVQLHDMSLWDGGWRYGLGIPSLVAYAAAQPDLSARWCFEYRPWRYGRPGHAAPTPDEVAEVVLATRPKLIGFTLTLWSDQTFRQAIARIKQEAPELLVVVGGPLVAGAGKAILRQRPAPDFVVGGYGELPFAELLRALSGRSPDSAALATIAGLWHHAGEESREAGWPVVLPPHEVPSPLRTGLLSLDDCPTLHVEWSRGCPTRCAYCNWGNAAQKVQQASRERILDDIAFAQEHGFDEITLNNAAINDHTGRLAELCDTLAFGSRGTDLRFVAFLRYELIDEDQLELLRKVPWRELTMGVQSDDDRALRTVGRPAFDRDCLEWAVEQLAAFTRPGVQLITALPGDTFDAFCRRLEWVRRLQAEVTVFPLQTPPGSRMYRDRAALGLHPDPRREYYVFGTDTLTPRAHAQCLSLASERLSAADERAACGVAVTPDFRTGLTETIRQSLPLVQLHQANFDDNGRNFGLGVPFLIAHCQKQPELAARYELVQSVWEVDSPDRFRVSEESMIQAILDDPPQVCGFSLHPWSARRFLSVLREVKRRHPQTRTVVGGSNATLEGAALLEEVPELDAVISGEGERPFASLLRVWADPDPLSQRTGLAAIGNLWARHDDEIVGGGYERYGSGSLDECGDPLTAGLVHLTVHNSHLNLEWTRGCPNQCAYCAWSRGQHTLRRFSLERIASDLRWAVAHDFTEIVICDAAINFEDGLLAELCQTLGETAPKLQYACFVHWPLVTAEQIVHMAPLRWSRLMIGVQTDDDKGLALLGRDPFDAEQLERCVRLLRPLGRPYLELMTGIPGDTADGLRRRVEYALSLDCRVSMFPLLAARGTRLRNRVLAAGARIDPRQHVVTELPTLSGDEYRAVITELGALDLSTDRLEIAGYDFLFRDKREEHSPARPATVLSTGAPITIAPGSQVFVHQAFTCCPYAALITAKIHDYFEQNGCEITDAPEHSALQVINTCGFNEERSERAVKAIGLIRRRAPETPLVVAGCLTRIEPERVDTPLAGGPPSLTIGPHEHDRFDTLFRDPQVAFADVRTNRYMERYSSGDPRLPLFQVLIATGCLNQCSYCVIRRAKGNVQSRPIADIIDEVRRGLALGHRDILLVADDIAAWGADLGSNVAELLQALAAVEGEVRYSAEALEPSRLIEHLDDCLDALGTGRFVWLVLPIQSGNDRVLSAMNRRYTRSDIEQAVSRLRQAAPEMVLTTDLIYGFGGETRQEFEDTLTLGALFDYCDFNEYEPRPGTPPLTVSADDMEHRKGRVQEFKRSQGSQVEKLIFCDLDDYVQHAPDSAAVDLLKELPTAGLGADYIPEDHPLVEAPPRAHDAAQAPHVPAPEVALPSPWVVSTARAVQERIDTQSPRLAAGWSIKHVRPEPQRVVIVVWHESAAEPLELILTPRDAQAPCIAFSKEHNLGLIWEKEAACQLDDGQVEGLTALQRLLGLRTNAPE